MRGFGRGRGRWPVSALVLSLLAITTGCGNDDDVAEGNIKGVCKIGEKLTEVAVGQVSAWLHGEGELLAELAAIVGSALAGSACASTLTYMRANPGEPITLRFTTDDGPSDLTITGSQLTPVAPTTGQCPYWSEYTAGDVIWCENGSWQFDLGTP